MQLYLRACEENKVNFEVDEFRLWVWGDENWCREMLNLNRQIDRALMELKNFSLIRRSKKSKSSRMSDVYISEEQQRILNMLSEYETDEEKLEVLISTANILDPSLKSRIEMMKSIQEILKALSIKRSAESIGLKNCIIGSVLGNTVRNHDLKKIDVVVRDEKLNELRTQREKILLGEEKSFINKELYASSRGLDDEVKSILQRFLLDDDVSHDDLSGRRMHINGKMEPIRILYTCGPRYTKALFDASPYAAEVEDHPKGIFISKERIEGVRLEMRYVKYFEKTSSGVDEIEAKAQLNYCELRKRVKANHPEHLHLFPVDWKEFLRNRICLEKLQKDESGDLIYTEAIHDCEDERCEKCTFQGFLSTPEWRQRVEMEENESSRLKVIIEDSNPLNEEIQDFHQIITNQFKNLSNLATEFENLEKIQGEIDRKNFDFTSLGDDIVEIFERISEILDKGLDADKKRTKQFKNFRRSFHLSLRDVEEMEDVMTSEEESKIYYKYIKGMKKMQSSTLTMTANLHYLCKNIIEHRNLLQGHFEIEEDNDEKWDTIDGHLGSLKLSNEIMLKVLHEILETTKNMAESFPMENIEKLKGVEKTKAMEETDDESSSKIKTKRKKKKKQCILTSHNFYSQVKEKDPTFAFIEEEMIDYHYFEDKSTKGQRKVKFSYSTRVRRKLPFGQFLVLVERDFSVAKNHLIRGDYQSWCRSQQIRKGLIPPECGWVIADFSTNVEVCNAKSITDSQWRTKPQWSLENMIAEFNQNDLDEFKKSKARSNRTNEAPEIEMECHLDGEEFLKSQLQERDLELVELKKQYPGEESIFNPTKILRKSGHIPKSVEYNLHFFSTDTKHDTHLHNLNREDYVKWAKDKINLTGIIGWSDKCTNQFLCVERFKKVSEDVQKYKLKNGNWCHLTWKGKGKGKIDLTGANATRKVKKMLWLIWKRKFNLLEKRYRI